MTILLFLKRIDFFQINGIKKNHIFLVTTICAISDFILIFLGIFIFYSVQTYLTDSLTLILNILLIIFLLYFLLKFHVMMTIFHILYFFNYRLRSPRRKRRTRSVRLRKLRLLRLVPMMLKPPPW